MTRCPTTRCSGARAGGFTSCRCRSRPLNAALDCRVPVPLSARRRRAGQAVASSQAVAALQRLTYHAAQDLQARRARLEDALSNKPMQRSAIRTAHTASWCRSRPLMDTLDGSKSMNTNENKLLEARINHIRQLCGEEKSSTDNFEAAALAQTVLHDTVGGSHPLMAVLRNALEKSRGCLKSGKSVDFTDESQRVVAPQIIVVEQEFE